MKRGLGLSAGATLVTALALHAALAWDGHLYWHEVRYLYATLHYSLADLGAGAWNPQFGQSLDPAADGVFYMMKLAFLAALKLLWAWVPPAAGGFTLAAALSLAAVIGACLLMAALMRRGFGWSAGDAAGAAALAALSPAWIWLGSKVLAEALALPALLVACLAGVSALDAAKPGRRRAFVGLCLCALALADLARPNLGVAFVALMLALAISHHCRAPRRRALGVAAAALALQMACLAVQLAAGGRCPADLWTFWQSFAVGRRSPWVSAAGGVAAFGWLLPLAAVGLSRLGPEGHARDSRRTLALWLVLAAVPTILASAAYQLEARYLVALVPPLSAAALLGVRCLALSMRGWLQRTPARRLAALGGMLAFLAGQVAALSVLPWEVDRVALDEIAALPALRQPGAMLLVPWGYSDFHYLRSLWPDLDTRLVQTPRDSGGRRRYSPEWRRRLEAWYGPQAYLGPETDLAGLAARRPVYQLWWGAHPPLAAWAERLRRLRFTGLAGRVESAAGLIHGDESWVAERSSVSRLVDRSRGIYRLERLSPVRTTD